jgi:hypothetical protein
MTTPRPFKCVWADGVFRPATPWHVRECAERFGEGEIVTLDQHEERSMASHGHYFAALNEAWQNLPESVAQQFLSFEHFRKTCLIRCGYANERQFVAGSKAEASRLAAFMRPLDEYAIVAPKECVVSVWTAKSQSMKAMGNAEFQDSKSKVLEYAASLVGVSLRELLKNTGNAA